VWIDRPAVGRKAAEALLARFEGRDAEKIVDIGFQVIERGTT